MGQGRDRKTEILRQAARVFLEEGYDAASMNRVADRAKLTKTGLYYHFRSKQDLLFSIMSHAMDLLEAGTREATLASTGIEDRLRKVIHHHAELITKEDGAFTILVIDQENALRPEDSRIIRHRKRAYFELVRAMLEQLRGEGRLRGVDPTVAAFSLLGMVVWIAKWYRSDGRLGPRDVSGEVTDLALAAVLEPPPRPA